MNKERSGITRRNFLGISAKAAGAVLASPYLHGLDATGNFLLGERPKKNEWEVFSPGEQVFASATKVIDGFYTAPSESAEVLPNKMLADYSDRSERIKIYPKRHMVNPGTVLRLRMTDKEWAEVLPQGDAGVPFIQRPGPVNYEKLDDRRVYVRQKDFAPITNFEPLNVLPTTEPKEKDIVVLTSPHPEILLLEGDQIVLRAPAVLGDRDHRTPYGTHKLTEAWPSRNMPGFPGVGFSLLINSGHGIYIHEAEWWTWENMEHGGYGSGGCVNMPDINWMTIEVDGEKISVAHFIFLWALTNYPSFDTKTMERMITPIRNPNIIPVQITGTIEGLKGKPRLNPENDWKQVTEQYKTLGKTQWILPGA